MQDRDRNLLFAVLAVQLKGVTPQRVIEAASAWMVDPSRPLSARLTEMGALRDEDVGLLDRLVDEAVRACQGNVVEALESIQGGDILRASLAGAPGAAPKDMTRPMAGTARFELEGPQLAAVEEIPGRYSQISEQGRGGMGRVLLVHDECLGRDIALKELLIPHDVDYTGPPPSPMRETTAMLARFLREARVTGQLEHPSIVPVYELGRRRNGSLYYTMKLVRGKTLAHAIRDAGSLEARLRLLPHLMDLCQALAYSHTRSVVHRDIKPANIMIGEFGETVLLDWGLAKVVGQADVHADEMKESLRILRLGTPEETPQTIHGEAVGTPHYMSPEQADGRIEDLDYRSDVYSVGAVLYELLVGEPPFSGRTAEEILQKVISEEPPPITDATPEAPPELVSICKKAMSKDPARRYASMTELRDELLRFAAGAFVQAYHYSPGEILRRYYRKNKTVVNTALACVVALLCVGVYSYISIWQARDREREQRVAAETARAREAKARDNAEQEAYLSQIRLAETLIRSNDTRMADEVLWNTGEERRGWEWALLLNEANREMFTVETPESWVFAAVFSPDGAKIATSAHPGPAGLWDARTGRLLHHIEGDNRRYHSIAFTPDGRRLTAAAEDGNAYVWDAASGALLRTLPGGAVAYKALPGRKSSRLYVAHDDQTIRVWDIESGQAIAAWTTGAGPVWNLDLDPTESRLISESGEGIIQVWDIAAGAPLITLGGYRARLSPSGTLIAGVDAENHTTTLLWDAATGMLLHRLEGHDQPVYALRFDKDSARLLTASFDGTVRLWDTAAGTAMRVFNLGDPAVDAFFANAGEYLLTCSGKNYYVLWDTATGSRVHMTQGHGAALSAADLSPDGQRLAVACAEHHFQVWNLMGATGVRTLDFPAGPPGEPQTQPLLDATISTDGRRAAAWWGDHKVTLYDLEGLGVLDHYQGPYPHYARAASLNGDGSRAVMVLDEFTPTVWESGTGGMRPPIAYHGHTAWVCAAAITRDGAAAASGSWDGTVHVWDAHTGAPLHILEGHTDQVTAVAFRSDGETLLTSALDGTAIVWSVAKGEKLLTLRGDDGSPVTDAAFNISGSRAITACGDGNVYVWDAVTGTRIDSLLGGREMGARGIIEQRARFGPDDRLIFTQNPSEALRVWHGQTHTLLCSLGVGDLLIPLPDHRSALWASLDTGLHMFETAPWLPAHRQQYAGTSWREQFQDYRLRQAQEPYRPRTSRNSGQIHVALAKEALAAGLDVLAEALAAGDGQSPTDSAMQPAIAIAGEGLPIPDQAFRPALAEIALDPGDAILQVNSERLRDATHGAAELSAAAQGVRTNDPASARLIVGRAGNTAELLYTASPMTREETQVSIDRDTAKTLLAESIRFLRQVRDNPAWMPRFGATRVQIDPMLDRQMLEAAALSPCDLVIGADNERFGDDAKHVFDTLQSLEAGLADSSKTEFALLIRRGAFRELTVHYAVR